MRTIYKYPIKLVDEQAVKMPRGASILHVALQRDILCLWALVQPDQPPEERTIIIVGTGHDADDLGRHIGTMQVANGDFVWHVFEKRS